MKKCKECNIKKQLYEFYTHPKMKDGHLNICKDCKKKYARKYCQTEKGKEVDKRRNKKPERKRKQYEYSKKSKKKYKNAHKATWKFWNEFRKGTIEKKPCDVCNATDRVEAHHSDYNKPLEVIWLCSLHHKEWHRNNKVLNIF